MRRNENGVIAPTSEERKSYITDIRDMFVRYQKPSNNTLRVVFVYLGYHTHIHTYTHTQYRTCSEQFDPVVFHYSRILEREAQDLGEPCRIIYLSARGAVLWQVCDLLMCRNEHPLHIGFDGLVSSVDNKCDDTCQGTRWA